MAVAPARSLVRATIVPRVALACSLVHATIVPRVASLDDHARTIIRLARSFFVRVASYSAC